MQRCIEEKDQIILNLENDSESFQSNIDSLKLQMIEKDRLIDHYRTNVEKSVPYRNLRNEYDIIIQQLQEVRIDNERYRRKAELLSLENDRIVSFALCEGLQVPVAASPIQS
jgi:hypothetical protein